MKTMNIKRSIMTIAVTAAALFAASHAQAQHTLGIVGGGGMTTGRLYPSQETRATWGVMSGGVSWRYYSLPRFVGCIGLDLEYIQRGFSYSPDAYRFEDKKDYHYYTRRYNSLSLPIVWQPHVYMFRNHVRVYLEAALNLELNLSATYDNGQTGISGTYHLLTVRDNRYGYGLAGGGGIDFLVGRVEFGFRVRYYFGLSDIMRNRNKYYDYATDDHNENPFWLTPLRSPVDNLMMSFKVGIRFGNGGFTEWEKRPKREKHKETFNFSLD